ncbi:DUF6531 domain-containing protein [Luteolibacter sp. LG18]|uniref:DUF6531 domain-containing protein n=1 Tax=Luteolibacter sp. LG18 TaxID=2819286 RepID=UPI0030C6D6D6
MGESSPNPAPAIVEIGPELRELANGLRNDPLRIFNYVRNEIESQLYFGLKKGPQVTFHEGSGNDLDKAFLLAALLESAKANDSSANIGTLSFATGWQELPYYTGGLNLPDVCSLWRISGSANPSGTNAGRYLYHPTVPNPTSLASKQLALAANVATDQGYWNASRLVVSNGNIKIRRFWLRMGSQNLDPWSVVYRQAPRRELTESPWAQPDPADLLHGTTAVDDTDPANESTRIGLTWTPTPGDSVATEMPISSSYKYDLCGFLGNRTTLGLQNIKKQENLGKISADNLLGRYKLVKIAYSALPEAGLTSDSSGSLLSAKLAARMEIYLGAGSYTVSGTTTNNTWSVLTPTLNERRVWVEFVGTAAQLNAEGSSVPLSTYTFPTVNTKKVILATKFVLPMSGYPANAEVKADVLVDRSSDSPAVQLRAYHTLFYGFNPKKGTLRYRQEKLDELMHQAERRFPGSVSSDAGILWLQISDLDLRKEIVLEMLNVQGLTWLSQTASARRTLGDVFDANLEKSFSLGRMSQNNAYFVDAFLQLTAASSRLGQYQGAGGEIAASMASMLVESGLEHSLIEQVGKVNTSNGKDKPPYGKSTVNQLGYNTVPMWVLTQGYIPGTESGFWGGSPNNTHNQRVTLKNDFTARLVAADSAIDNTQQSLWRYPAISLRGYSDQAEAFISMNQIRMSVGDSQGGYSVAGELIDPNLMLKQIVTPAGYNQVRVVPGEVTISEPTCKVVDSHGADPVNLYNGSFDYADVDLKMGSGEFPQGLTFQRYYSSANAHRASAGMGFGWTHNWNLFITETSAADLALGDGSARQMVPFLVTAKTLKEYLIPPAYASAGVADPATLNPVRWHMCVWLGKWAADQLTHNAIVATLGNESETFVLMPDGSYESGSGSGMVLSRDATSREFTLVQKGGNTIVFNPLYSGYYYNQGRASSLTGPDGQTLNFSWNTNGLQKVESTVGGKNRGISFTYATTGSHLMTNAKLYYGTDSVSTLYGYDGNGNLKEQTDPENLTPVQSEYANSNNKTRYYYREDEVSSPSDTFRARMTKVVNPENQVTALNAYDQIGRVSSQYQNGDTASQPWLFFYNGIRNEEQDPANGIKQYLYSDRGQLWGEVDALGYTTTRVFDDEGRIIKETDPAGGWVQTTYDVNSNPILTNRYANSGQTVPWTTAATFDSLSRPLNITDELGRTTTFTYFPGSTSRSAQTMTLDGKTTTYTLMGSGWAKGMPATITDRDGYVTTYTYNEAGWTASIVERNAPAKTFSNYNIFGSPGTTVDENGHTDTATYNNRDQVISATRVDPNNSSYSHVGRTIYDACGRIVREETDTGRSGGKKIVATTYSASDLKLVETSAGGDGVVGTSDDVAQTWTYDARDFLMSETDIYGNTTTHEYFANGKEKKSNLPADPVHGARAHNYLVDNLGRVTDASDVLNRNTHTAYGDHEVFSMSTGGSIRGSRSTATDPMNFNIVRYSVSAPCGLS